MCLKSNRLSFSIVTMPFWNVNRNSFITLILYYNKIYFHIGVFFPLNFSLMPTKFLHISKSDWNFYVIILADLYSTFQILRLPHSQILPEIYLPCFPLFLYNNGRCSLISACSSHIYFYIDNTKHEQGINKNVPFV